MNRVSRLFLYLALTLAALYALAPMWVMLVTSFKTLDEVREGSLLAAPHAPTIEPWLKAWGTSCTGVRCDGLKPFFFNSLIMTIPAVLISTLIGALNGYVLTHWRFRGSDLLFTLLLVGCFIPFQVVLLPMARALGAVGLSNSVFGLIFVHVVYGLAFTTLFFRNYYLGVPVELVRAARVDGASFFVIFRRILLPISGPIFMVCVIWQFTQIWNDFLFGVVFAGADSQPVTVALNNLVRTSTGVKEYNVDMAATILTGLVPLAIYFFSGKYFVRGIAAGAVKG